MGTLLFHAWSARLDLLLRVATERWDRVLVGKPWHISCGPLNAKSDSIFAPINTLLPCVCEHWKCVLEVAACKSFSLSLPQEIISKLILTYNVSLGYFFVCTLSDLALCSKKISVPQIFQDSSKDLLLPSSQLDIGPCLGKGNFGEVYEGLLHQKVTSHL